MDGVRRHFCRVIGLHADQLDCVESTPGGDGTEARYSACHHGRNGQPYQRFGPVDCGLFFGDHLWVLDLLWNFAKKNLRALTQDRFVRPSDKERKISEPHFNNVWLASVRDLVRVIEENSEVDIILGDFEETHFVLRLRIAIVQNSFIHPHDTHFNCTLVYNDLLLDQINRVRERYSERAVPSNLAYLGRKLPFLFTNLRLWWILKSFQTLFIR